MPVSPIQPERRAEVPSAARPPGSRRPRALTWLLAATAVLTLLGLALGLALGARLAPEGRAVAPGQAANGLIAFARTAGRTSDLWTFDPVTGQEAVLLTGHGPVGSPAWAPDGAHLAFAGRDERYRGFQIHVLALTTGMIDRLLDPLAIDGSPSWSPDGERIAFSSNRDGAFAVHVMGRDGSGLQRLEAGRSPAWSPDGTSIAFVRLVEGRERIFVMTSGGSQVQRLTDGPGDDRDPAWSPDGRSLVVSRGNGGRSEIIVLDMASGEARPITDGSRDDRSPTWSPDGRWIVFSGFSGLDGSSRDLWLVGSDGSGLRRLTDDPLSDVNPSWQPLASTP